MFTMSFPEIIILLAEVALLAFWIWMLLDVIRSTHLTRNSRIWWLLGFVLFGALAAIVYFFMHYTREGDEGENDDSDSDPNNSSDDDSTNDSTHRRDNDRV
jgi:cytoskeletal protein RodZ